MSEVKIKRRTHKECLYCSNPRAFRSKLCEACGIEGRTEKKEPEKETVVKGSEKETTAEEPEELVEARKRKKIVEENRRRGFYEYWDQERVRRAKAESDRIAKFFAGKIPEEDYTGVEPTTAAPGTEDKLVILERRFQKKQPLFHPDDNVEQRTVAHHYTRHSRIAFAS